MGENRQMTEKTERKKVHRVISVNKNAVNINDSDYLMTENGRPTQAEGGKTE